VFPVRYGLNSYISVRRNCISMGLSLNHNPLLLGYGERNNDMMGK
jgi:hypothetical protein